MNIQKKIKGSMFLMISCSILSASSAAARTQYERRDWCAESSMWKGKEVKVLNDCDILKDQIPVFISRVTERSECINALDLSIGGEQMSRKKTLGKQLRIVHFKNLLQDREKTKKFSRVQVTLTAMVDNRYLQTQFFVEVSSCSKDEANIENEEDNEIEVSGNRNAIVFGDEFIISSRPIPGDGDDYHDDNDDDDQEDDDDDNNNDKDDNRSSGKRNRSNQMILIAAGSAVGSLLFIGAITIGCLCKRKSDKRKKGNKNPMNIEENHTYGTYSRGWEEEGEYGDGDKVYVTDTNDYYSK